MVSLMKVHSFIRGTVCIVHSLGFNKFVITYPSLQQHTKQYYCSENALYSTYQPSFSRPKTPGNQWPFYYCFLPFLQCHPVEIIYYLDFFQLAIFTQQHIFKFLLYLFKGDSSFFLSLYYIPLSGYTTVCLSIELQKDILVTFMFQIL